MQPAVAHPFQRLVFNGISIPVYGSLTDPLFTVSDISIVHEDVTLKSTAKKDRPAPYTTWLYVANREGEVVYTQLFTRLGLCKYVFAKTKPVEGFSEWVLTTFDTFARESYVLENEEAPQAEIQRPRANLDERVDRLEKALDAIRKAILP